MVFIALIFARSQEAIENRGLLPGPREVLKTEHTSGTSLIILETPGNKP